MGGFWVNYIRSEDPKYDFDPSDEQNDSDSEDQPMHEVTLDEEDKEEEEYDEDGFEDSGDVFDEEADVEDY
jgi:hypothetical protein